MALTKKLEEFGIELSKTVGLIISKYDQNGQELLDYAHYGRIVDDVSDELKKDGFFQDYDPQTSLLHFWNYGKSLNMVQIYIPSNTVFYHAVNPVYENDGYVVVENRGQRIVRIGQSEEFLQATCDSMAALAG